MREKLTTEKLANKREIIQIGVFILGWCRGGLHNMAREKKRTNYKLLDIIN